MTQQDVHIRLVMDGAQGVTAVTGAFNGLEQGITRSAKAAESLTSHVARMGHFAAGLFSVRELAQAADAFASINSQLKIATGSASAAQQAYQSVHSIAMSTGQSLEQAATVYRRFAENASDMGASMEDVARRTETVAKLVALSGGSAASAEAALTQFGQALASGVLRGEELNSVMEQTPALARALAEGMGLTVGQLRSAAAEGQITAHAIAQALDTMKESVDKQFADVPETIGRAMTNFKTALVDTVGTVAEASGAIKVFSGALNTAATAVSALTPALTLAVPLAAGKLAGVIANLGKSFAGMAAQSVSVAAATSTVARAADAQTAALLANQTRVVQLSAAFTKFTPTLAGVVSSSGLLRGALALLGGPIGAITTALFAGVAAWNAWERASIQSLENAASWADRTVPQILARMGQLGKMNVADFSRELDKQANAIRNKRKELFQLQWDLSAEERADGDLYYDGGRQDRIDAMREKIRALQDEIPRMERLLQVTTSKIGEVGRAAIDEAHAAAETQLSAQEKAWRERVEKVRAGIDTAMATGNIAEAETLKAKLAAITAEHEKTSKAAKESERAQREALRAAAREQKTVEDAAAKVRRELIAQAEAAARAAQSEADSAHRTTDGLREQLQTLGMSRTELARYNAAKLETAAAAQTQAAAEAEASLQMLAGKKAAKEQVDALRQTIAARRDAARELREQARLTVDISVKEAAQEQARAAEEAARESARAAEEEWRQTAQSIQTSITDALMRGFEDGKGFARNLRDTIKNLFNSLVLRPVVSATVGALIPGSVMAAGTQALGGADGGGLFGNLLGGGNLLSAASSLWSAFSGSLVSAASNGIAAIGSAIGSNALATFAGGMYMNLLGSVGASTAASIGGATAAGSMFATALPFIGGALAIAAPLIGKLFGGKPSNKAAWGSVELASGRTYDVGNMTGEKQASQETLNARDAFVQSVSTVAQQLRALGGEFDQLANIRIDIGERDGIQADFGNGLERLGADAEQALNEITARMVNDVKGSLPSAMREIVDSMSGDYTRLIDVLDIAKNGIVSIETPLSSLARMSGSIATALTEAGAPMASTVYQMNDLGRTLDLTTEEGRRAALALREVAPAMQQIKDAAQRPLDGLVYCAGQGGISRLSDLKPETAQAMMTVNFFSFIECVRQLVKGKRKEGEMRIIGISSLASTTYSKHFTAYAASKAAMEAAVRTLSAELLKKSVHIFSIKAGYADTPMAASMDAITGGFDQHLRETGKQPMGLLSTENLAGFIHYLLSSPTAPYMTGTNIAIPAGTPC